MAGARVLLSGQTSVRGTLRLLLLAAAVTVLVMPPQPAAGQVLDGTAADGRAGFYFLPPMVPDPGVAGDFDADLNPEVDICVLDAERSACTSQKVASLDMNGRGRDVITVSPKGESYNAVWPAPKNLALSSDAPTSTRYRLEVFQQVGTQRVRLGFADLWVVDKPKDLGATPAGYVGTVRGNPFQIKFRIQTTAIGLVTVTPDPASIPAGQTQEFTAAVTDLHGDPVSGTAVAWATDPAGVASLDPTATTTDGDGQAGTTATGDEVGTTTVSATAGGVAGSATLEVFAPEPVLEDDELTTTIGEADLVANVTDNDFLGVPAGSVASFGGGSLGGSVTDHAAGSSPGLAGGTLTLAADGALTLETPTTAGVYTFDYRVTNSAGSDDATVTITVQRVPDARDDAISVAPGQALSGDVFADNGDGPDDLGFPAGAVAGFGGGDLGGEVDSNEPGDGVALGNDGTVTLDADGTLSGTAPTATGAHTFDYLLSNDAGSDTATVTITVQRPPTAADDEFTANAGITLNGDVFADNGAGADDLGEPPAVVASFGGGSLGGSVTDHAAGSSPGLAGGTLTLAADGTLTLASTTTGGEYTFDYRLTNAAGSDDATVTISVHEAPTAVADAPTATSEPGDAWHTALDTALDSTTHATPGVLANDTLGFPSATVTHFGGGTLGGSTDSHEAGDTAVADGHSLSVDADGQLAYTPKSGFTGTFTFSYRLANSGGASDATVTLAVGERPVAVADTYPHTLVGNVGIDTAGTDSPFSVLANDSGDNLTVNVGAATNGAVTLNADGTFTFNPAAGFRSGNASFTYTVSNGFGTSAPATVTIPVGAQVIWFVNNNAPACTALVDGCGRLTNPLSSLSAFNTLNTGTGSNPADNHHVFVHESSSAYPGPLALRNGQRLIGQDATSSLAVLSGVSLPPHSPALPAMNSGNATTTTITSSADGVTLGQGNRLHGFRLSNATGTALTGTGFGTLVVSDVAINTTGRALNLENGTAGSPFAFTSVTSSGGANNIRLAAGAGVLAGTFDLGGGALSGSTAEAFLVSGGAGSVSYSGSVSNGVGRSVSVSGKSGGSVTLGGAVTDTGTGISLVNNTGASVAFSGTLSVTTSGNVAFAATGGGTVTATGANSVLSASGARALQVVSTTIGAGGLTFKSVSASGGVHGIELSATGAGAVTVAGDGSASRNGSGGTVSGMSSHGVTLSNTGPVTLRNMNILDNTGVGVRAQGSSGVAVVGGRLEGNTSDASNPATRNSIWLRNVTGQVRLEDSFVTGSAHNQVDVENTAGTVTVSVLRSEVRDNGINSGLQVEAMGTSTVTLNVTDSTFAETHATGVHAFARNTALLTVLIDGNTFEDNNVAVNLAAQHSATLRSTVSDNTISGHASHSINATVHEDAVHETTISGNTVDTAATNASVGIRVVSEDDALMRALVEGNTVSGQTTGHGFRMLAREGEPAVHLVLRDNDIVTTSTSPAYSIEPLGTATEGPYLCAAISGNTGSSNHSSRDLLVDLLDAGARGDFEGAPAGTLTQAQLEAHLSAANPGGVSADHDIDRSVDTPAIFGLGAGYPTGSAVNTP